MHNNSDIECPLDHKILKFTDFHYNQFKDNMNLVIKITKELDETL